MTAQEAIIEVYEALGEPSDLPIYAAGGAFDITAAGSVRILAALNRAQDYVATYRIPNGPNAGRALYFRAMQGNARFQPVIVSGALGTQTDASFLTVNLGTTLSASGAGRFSHWIAKFEDGSIRRVMLHSVTAGVGTLRLDNALTSDVSAETIYLYKAHYTLRTAAEDPQGDNITISSGTRVFEILKVFNNSLHFELPRVAEDLFDNAPQLGSASSWVKRANYLVFDVALDNAAETYNVHYCVLPSALTAANASFALPATFHEAIVLWATRWGFQRMMESTNAYAIKKDFEDVMRTAQTQIDAEDFVGGDYLSPDLG